MAMPKSAMTIKLLTNQISAEMKNDYVKTAMSRGNSDSRILYRHVLKKCTYTCDYFLAMLPASMIASSIVVEQVFGIAGLGELLIASISNRDFPVVQAIILFVATIVIVLNFLVDILYNALDPRVQVQS